MSSTLDQCAEISRQLCETTEALQDAGKVLEITPLEEWEWYQVLKQKLLPQLQDDVFLVAAVVGGTNIGKSVIFNHLAGVPASAVSPLASGTKHPVCLVPPGFAENHDLQRIFEGFQLTVWSSSEDAMQESDENRLFWRESAQTAENLLVLDTPDIDSDARVNWQRAGHIRRSADVLIGVLTQQKYNDAAVKQFFRTAAGEDKAVILVFNQCQLPEDDEYWPLWLETFCRETGVRPEFVYLVPNDRPAAAENRLLFFERRVAFNAETAAVTSEAADDRHRSLAEDLSRLRFEEVKLRSLRGSLKHLADPEQGIPAWLGELAERSRRFGSAVELLSTEKLARTDNWPVVPHRLLIGILREWWQGQRTGWPARVHDFYNGLGRVVMWPFRAADRRLRGDADPPLVRYRKAEWSAVLETVENVYDRLRMLAESGNPILRERLQALLGGKTRARLLQELEAAHAEADLETQLAGIVTDEMHSFSEESPRFYRLLKHIDQSTAVVRPATSVALFFTGVGPAGDAAAQLAANSLLQSVVHVAGDVTGGTVAAAVGDTAISGTASGGVGYIEAKLRKLQQRIAAARVQWLLKMLEQHLWHSLVDDLRAGATILQTPEYTKIEQAIDQLEKQLKPQKQTTNV